MKLTKLELNFHEYEWVKKHFNNVGMTEEIDIKDVLEHAGVNAALDYLTFYDHKPFQLKLCKWVKHIYKEYDTNKHFRYALKHCEKNIFDKLRLLDQLRDDLPIMYLQNIAAGHAAECVFLTTMAYLGRFTLKETAFSALTAFVAYNQPDEQRPFAEYPKTFSALHDQGLANISNFIIDFVKDTK